MSEDAAERSDRCLVLVNVESPALEELKRDLPTWRWLAVEPDPERVLELVKSNRCVDAILVFARPKEEERAVTLCEGIRGRPELSEVAVLLAVNSYQLIFGNQVRRLPNAHFVLTPIVAKELHDRLAELRSTQNED